MCSNWPKNLETDFDKLCIAPEPRTRMRSRSLSYITNKLPKLVNSKRRKSLIIPARVCGCKKERAAGKSFLRPARLNLSSISKKKSIYIRPAKLNVKESKIFLLKPATLIVEDKRKSLKSFKFDGPNNSLPGIPFSVGQVFSSDKLKSQTSFRSLITNEDSEISKAFDALSFKKMRHKKSPVSAELPATNKRDNTSSCSVQARMESSVPIDCDDTSIEELASYFDLFVHIPKKMSSMAEMMYI